MDYSKFTKQELIDAIKYIEKMKINGTYFIDKYLINLEIIKEQEKEQRVNDRLEEAQKELNKANLNYNEAIYNALIKYNVPHTGGRKDYRFKYGDLFACVPREVILQLSKYEGELNEAKNKYSKALDTFLKK